MGDDRASIFRKAKKQGWTIQMSDHHLILQAPDGAAIFTSATPSDWRTKKNMVARMRKHGFKTG